MQYAGWALERNQTTAARVFTERVEGEKSEQLEPHNLLGFLKPYPNATRAYLEHLVYVKKQLEEMFHTQLANAYLHRLTQLRDGTGSDGEIKKARYGTVKYLSVIKV